MFNSINEKAVSKRLHSILFTFMALAISTSVVSCGSDDEPDNDAIEEPASALVTEAELVGKWTLVQDEVLYSQVNTQQEDETIAYKGSSYPRYRFYHVTVSEEGIITMTETTSSGSAINEPVQYTLNGNNLTTVEDGEVAGTIEHYDPSHAWDNLRIKWNKDYCPIQFGAPAISTYML